MATVMLRSKNSKTNRAIISRRLAHTQMAVDINNPINQNARWYFPVGYGENSSDVLLPAFLATYTGQSPTKVKTSPFRDIPIPNWRINYKGLMKFAWFKKHFRSFTLRA